ncbi:MAG: glycosyltransferase [Ferruginibacter sp.]|nr:glycosyltransferase [Ferruginibacter sp.]
MKLRLVRMTAASMALKVSTRGQPRYMSQHGFDVTMISSDGWELPAVIALEKVPHITVNLPRKLTPIADARAIWKLYRLFKQLKPHIIHTENLKANLCGLIAGWMAGVPVRIQTMAGLVSPTKKGIKGWMVRQAEIISCWFATDVWPNSYSSLEFMLKTRMVNPKKARVIGKGSTNGIDLERFNPDAILPQRLEEIKKSIHWQPEDKILLFVGRMVREKGVEELVAAFEKIQTQYPNLKLVLLGPEEADLDPLSSATIQAIQFNPRIIHIEWTDEVEYYLALSGLFVFPSYREGFPNVIMQAGAMKCPVVCARVFGNVDIIRDKENGILHEAQNTDALVEALHFALKNPGLTQKFSAQLYEEMVKDFDRYSIYKLYIKEYYSLVESRSNHKS